MEDSSGMEEIEVSCQCAVLDAENLCDKNIAGFSIYWHKYQQNSEKGSRTFLYRDLLDEEKEKFIPQYMLTLRFRIEGHKSVVKSSEIVRLFLRTQIPVSQCVFSSWVSSFDNVSNSFSLPIEVVNTASINLNQVYDERGKRIEIIIDSDFKKIFSWKCDIRDCKNKEQLLLCDDTILPELLPYKRDFDPCSILSIHSKTELICNFVIVLHELKNCCEARIKSNHEAELTTRDKMRAQDKVQDDSLQSDFRNIYDNGLLSDFTVKVQEKSFDVHSLILAARSPVLKRMLETNMKESNDKTLELDDLDEPTVSKMLDYLYTDDAGSLCFESAVKLFYAGDKYEMQGLKKKSSAFLVSSLSRGNVCEVLELADRHQDAHLKSNAIEFIHEHEREMTVESDELEIFSQKNPELCLKTMFELAKMKLK